ncbi:archaeal proteasome endopeptidase complex subunit alpha [Sulfuracidifex metallicus]|uniref:archaeal proteasome endopeptidase complex subunit alpha n=1 Tax=Sulfuracidifex metallicus TaxID=47303 RepID=UPI00227328B1|nr:archaeal proteasome endopeptidase complex subunit alpha [Sulfuracidifex metallicus]MCY0849193.1 archaeal proteasome endopeptidase complex subunit alpha [Sulfuracidifex metallicus]
MALGPAAMGYDRAITIFSPDGSLYQVDYAFGAVKKGWTTLGIKTNSGVVIASEKKRESRLLDLDNIEKVFIIDDHIGCSFAGLASDGRILIDYARTNALQHRLVYDEPISVAYLTKLISDVKQAYTQHGGVRPFGVALLIAGIDKRTPKLYLTEPSGQFTPYQAIAIGQGDAAATEYLEKNYKADLSMEDSVILALKALQTVQKPGEKLTPNTVELGIASVETGTFRKSNFEERQSFIQKLG